MGYVGARLIVGIMNPPKGQYLSRKIGPQACPKMTLEVEYVWMRNDDTHVLLAQFYFLNPFLQSFEITSAYRSK